MTEVSSNNKRIAKNTLMLYIRQFFILAITLFTSRVVIQTLGVTDYGIYNVVGGLVVLMTTVNSAMSVATTRYITFELGRGEKNFERLHKTFCISLTTYFIISIIFVILAETLGLWFLNTHLNIPNERMFAANWIYQVTIFTVTVNLICNPYNAVIIAHERMGTYAYVSILEATLKLAIAYLLSVSPIDRLIAYSTLLLLQALIICMIYRVYCLRNFRESHFEFYKDNRLLKKLFSYTGWNIFGSLGQMLQGQGLNILLNLFFNPAINAARAIAYQVNTAIYQFSSNFFTAVRPQITKYYAKNETSELFKLVFRASRFSFYLLMIVSIPVVIEAPFIIKLWLGQLPDYVVEFVRIVIAISAVEAMQHPVTSIVHATGKIAIYQCVVSSTIIMIVPISYFFLKMGTGPISVFIVSFIVNFIALFLRLLIVSNLVGFPVKKYIVDVILRNLIVVAISFILPLMIHLHLTQESVLSVILIFIISLLSSTISILYLGFNGDERCYILNVAKSKFNCRHK